MLICQYCSKECKNSNSHRNHERSCPKNLNRNYKNGMTGKTAWNKGLTIETDERVKRGSITSRSREHRGFTKGSKHTKETKEKISETMSKITNNRYTASKRHYHNGFRLESSWELRLALDLDKHNISWVRPEPLIYKDDLDQTRRYYPDFYLVDYDVYLDPKNDYVRKLDKQKLQWVIDQNGIDLLILYKSQLSWEACSKLLLDLNKTL